MKIIRSVGDSTTGFDHQPSDLPPEKRAGLARGLVPKTDRTTTVNSLDLPDWIGRHPDLAIRKVISILDKVIKKPRRLNGFDVVAYIDRTKLAQQLWDRLSVTRNRRT